MKEEEFNDFLRNRADSFELKPSSGSFDEVARKLNRKKRKRGVILFLLPLLLLGGISAGYYFTSKNTGDVVKTALNNKEVSTPIENTPQKQFPSSLNANNEEESNLAANTPKKTLNPQNLEVSEPVVNVTISKEKNKRDNFVQKIKAIDTENIAITSSNIKVEGTGDGATASTFIDTDTNNGNSETVLIEGNANENSKPEASTIDINSDASPTIVEKIKDVENIPANENRPEISGCATCLTKRWTVRAYYNPFNMSYYKENIDVSLNENAPLPLNGQFSYERNFIKENLNGKANFGINLEYRLIKRLSLGSGVRFSKWSSEIKEWTVLYRNDIVNVYSLDTSSNTLIALGTEEVFSKYTKDSNTYTSNVSSIQIPLYFNLSLLQKPRFSLDASVGVVANYMKSVTTIKDPKQSLRFNNTAVKPKDFYNDFNLNATAGLFANYTIGKCWGIYIGPRFGLAVTGIHKNKSFKNSKPYNWGLETGIKINF